jgi:hypothetical protein
VRRWRRGHDPGRWADAVDDERPASHEEEDMRKILTIVFGVIVAVIIGFAISALASPETERLTEIRFVTCDDPQQGVKSDPEYPVQPGDTVRFVNDHEDPEMEITITLPGCDIFAGGTPEEIELASGASSRAYHVRDGAQPCHTHVEPTCMMIDAGPIIIPEGK